MYKIKIVCIKDVLLERNILYLVTHVHLIGAYINIKTDRYAINSTNCKPTKNIFLYTYNMTRLGNEENESFEISTIELLPKFL